MRRTKAARREEVMENYFSLIEQTQSGRLMLSDFFQKELPNIIENLQCMANGAWIKEVVSKRDEKSGEVKFETRVYQMLPDKRAIKQLTEMAGHLPSTPEAQLESFMKSSQIAVEVQANLGKSKARQAEALARRAEIETAAFTQSIVTEEEMERQLRNLVNVCISYFDKIPLETMIKTYCQSEESYQNLKARFGKVMMDALDVALADEEEPKSITDGDED